MFIEQKGKYNVDWKDFDHLEGLKEKEQVSDSVSNVYKLNYGSKIYFSGNSYKISN